MTLFANFESPVKHTISPRRSVTVGHDIVDRFKYLCGLLGMLIVEVVAED
jgi:hypothetical protein